MYWEKQMGSSKLNGMIARSEGTPRAVDRGCPGLVLVANYLVYFMVLLIILIMSLIYF
jgi:hypothetical protein